MKKLLRSLLLAAVLTTVLCVGALAADGDPTVDGIYNVNVEAADTLTPQDASGTAVSATNEGGAYSAFYKGAVKLSVDVSGLQNGEQYLLLIVKNGTNGALTGDSIYYIAQTAATTDGKVAFTAYPKTMSSGSYTVYLTGGGRTISSSARVGSFDYYQAYTLGDVNGDTKITVADALAALQMSVGIGDDWTPIQRKAADVDLNDRITVADALAILQRSVGLRENFD